MVAKVEGHMTRTRTARRQLAGNFVRLPGSRWPFKRALVLMTQMQAIVDKGLNPTDRQIEINALPPYVSRGHGGRQLVGSRWFRDRSKYDPREEDKKHYPTPADLKLRQILGLDSKRHAQRTLSYVVDFNAYVDRIAARQIKKAK